MASFSRSRACLELSSVCCRRASHGHMQVCKPSLRIIAISLLIAYIASYKQLHVERNEQDALILVNRSLGISDIRIGG